MEPSTTVQCSGTCTLVIDHRINWADAISSPLTSDQVGDYMAVWAAFLAAGVAVLVVKAIYNRFRIDHEG